MTAMRSILYLAHRLPYPPNKGDKLRSFNCLRYLAKRHRVFLATFVDSAADRAYVSALQQFCAGHCVVPLWSPAARLRSLTALVTGEPLTTRYYRSAKLKRWIDATLRAERIDTAVVFCSAMAQYIDDIPNLRVIADFVDVDSAKWAEYADLSRWPVSWLYRREAKNLLAFERMAAARSSKVLFVTQAEAELFRTLAPECANQIEVSSNGVDAAYFDPEQDCASPYRSDEIPIVFTGAMDYRPNVQAVRWFVSEVLPALAAYWPNVRFHIVGSRPVSKVTALRATNVVISADVPDIRPYMRHASVAVAPLKVARGVQNKILEAMAMARPVVASNACVAALGAMPGRDLHAAGSAREFVEKINLLLTDIGHAKAMGVSARQYVLTEHDWATNLALIDRYVDRSDTAARGAAVLGSPFLEQSAGRVVADT